MGLNEAEYHYKISTCITNISNNPIILGNTANTMIAYLSKPCVFQTRTCFNTHFKTQMCNSSCESLSNIQ